MKVTLTIECAMVISMIDTAMIQEQKRELMVIDIFLMVDKKVILTIREKEVKKIDLQLAKMKGAMNVLRVIQ